MFDISIIYSLTPGEIDNCKYDFKINNKKVQEKISRNTSNKLIYRVSLSSGYKIGDNAFYFIWIPDSSLFYVFPETILKHYNYFDGKKCLDIRLHPYYNKSYRVKHCDLWVNDYLFDYNNLAKSVLINMINQ